MTNADLITYLDAADSWEFSGNRILSWTNNAGISVTEWHGLWAMSDGEGWEVDDLVADEVWEFISA